jgi:hypothetical protein
MLFRPRARFLVTNYGADHYCYQELHKLRCKKHVRASVLTDIVILNERILVYSQSRQLPQPWSI